MDGEAGSKKKMHQHVWSWQQTSKMSKTKLVPAAERNRSSILNGLCVTVSFQPFGTRVRHKVPRQAACNAGTTTAFCGVIVSSTRMALPAMQMAKNP